MMRKSILVTGKSGQVGRSIQSLASEYLEFEFTFVGRDELDLNSSGSITQYFVDRSYDVIINCAAYTAVDKAESEQENADQVNHNAVRQLSEICKQKNIVLIHISTDYVYGGENCKPYVESDETKPQNVYGLTKLKGEQAIQHVKPRGCVLRTSWVYSEYGNNFVKTMLRLGQERSSLGVIFDQVGSPTFAKDLAKALLELASETFEENSVEVYNYSNEGVCSWYDFAKEIFSLSGIDCKVSPIETKEYPMPAKRPFYSVMNKGKLKHGFGLEIPYWKDSLQKCLQNLQS